MWVIMRRFRELQQTRYVGTGGWCSWGPFVLAWSDPERAYHFAFTRLAKWDWCLMNVETGETIGTLDEVTGPVRHEPVAPASPKPDAVAKRAKKAAERLMSYARARVKAGV